MKNRMLLLISPTYYLYKHLKKEDCAENKVYNKVLADNYKYLSLALALYIYIFIVLNETTKRQWKMNYEVNVITVIADVTYVIVAIIIPYTLFNLLMNELKNYYENHNGKSINIYLDGKKLNFCLHIVLSIYINLLMQRYGNSDDHEIVRAILFILMFWIYGISRPIHFCMVFWNDMLKKITQGVRKSREKRKRLVLIALGSYVSLILDYGILYYVIDLFTRTYKYTESIKIYMFNENFPNIVDAIYYSLITISSVGYGERFPVNIVSKIFVSMQVISGMTLLVVNLAIYMGGEEK